MNIHEMLKLITIMMSLLEKKIISTFTVCIATWSAVSVCVCVSDHLDAAI